jgi:hypothetical protein
MKTNSSALGALVCITLFATACGGEAEETETTLSPLWTGYTSEELPPISCTGTQLVRGIDCDGSYCDNVRIDCVSSGRTLGDVDATDFFSEEGAAFGNNQRTCAADQWMTGISCQGNYCDRISLECMEIVGSIANDCQWTTPTRYSEEDPPFSAGAGRFVRGVRCFNSNCDRKEYFHCQLL